MVCEDFVAESSGVGVEIDFGDSMTIVSLSCHFLLKNTKKSGYKSIIIKNNYIFNIVIKVYLPVF